MCNNTLRKTYLHQLSLSGQIEKKVAYLCAVFDLDQSECKFNIISYTVIKYTYVLAKYSHITEV